MQYFTYFGNHLVNAKMTYRSVQYAIGSTADKRNLVRCNRSIRTILKYSTPNRRCPEFKRAALRDHTQNAFENPLDMPPLKELVDGNSKVLILFDDNCQPFPATKKPDMRQIMTETLLKMLYEYGVDKKNIQLMCAVALHRKMKEHELAYMLGKDIMDEFYPHQLRNILTLKMPNRLLK